MTVTLEELFPGTRGMTREELSELVAAWFARCSIYGDDGQFQVMAPLDQAGMDAGARLYTVVMQDRAYAAALASLAAGQTEEDIP